MLIPHPRKKRKTPANRLVVLIEMAKLGEEALKRKINSGQIQTDPDMEIHDSNRTF